MQVTGGKILKKAKKTKLRGLSPRANYILTFHKLM
jgi:hypothetical protein